MGENRINGCRGAGAGGTRRGLASLGLLIEFFQALEMSLVLYEECLASLEDLGGAFRQ